MLTLALDPSSTACGWALFYGRELHCYGAVRRQKKQDQWAYAWAVQHAVPTSKDRVVYEINDGASIPRKRQRSMRIAHEATGRILQALGVAGEPIQADNRKKPARREEMRLIYGVPDSASEHAVDAIALGHRVVSEIKAQKGPSPKRTRPRQTTS